VFTDDRSLDVDETWAALQEYYTLQEMFETPSREEHAKLFQVIIIALPKKKLFLIVRNLISRRT
jgi:hypothetical protein